MLENLPGTGSTLKEVPAGDFLPSPLDLPCPDVRMRPAAPTRWLFTTAPRGRIPRAC